MSAPDSSELALVASPSSYFTQMRIEALQKRVDGLTSLLRERGDTLSPELTDVIHQQLGEAVAQLDELEQRGGAGTSRRERLEELRGQLDTLKRLGELPEVASNQGLRREVAAERRRLNTEYASLLLQDTYQRSTPYSGTATYTAEPFRSSSERPGAWPRPA